MKRAFHLAVRQSPGQCDFDLRAAKDIQTRLALFQLQGHKSKSRVWGRGGDEDLFRKCSKAREGEKWKAAKIRKGVCALNGEVHVYAAFDEPEPG